jgi:hypothetical protein
MQSTSEPVQIDSPDKTTELLRQIDTILSELRKRANPSLSEQPFSFINQMQQEYSTFFEAYPKLFDLMCKDPYHFERGRLVQMLQMRNRIYNKELSYEQASKNVGKQYYEEFVKPTIPKEYQPSESEMERIMNIKDPEEQRRLITQLLKTKGAAVEEKEEDNGPIRVRERK